jgi:hypothetical protein
LADQIQNTQLKNDYLLFNIELLIILYESGLEVACYDFGGENVMINKHDPNINLDPKIDPRFDPLFFVFVLLFDE